MSLPRIGEQGRAPAAAPPRPVPGAVTELSFGGAAIGNLFRAVTDDDARAAVDAAWEGGIRAFDTAPHYGLGRRSGGWGTRSGTVRGTST